MSPMQNMDEGSVGPIWGMGPVPVIALKRGWYEPCKINHKKTLDLNGRIGIHGKAHLLKIYIARKRSTSTLLGCVKTLLQ